MTGCLEYERGWHVKNEAIDMGKIKSAMVYDTLNFRHWFIPCFSSESLFINFESLITQPIKSDLLRKVKLGKQIVANLSSTFKKQNQGQYVAVSFSGRILAVGDTLESLNRQLLDGGISEDYYVERLGYESIAQLD